MTDPLSPDYYKKGRTSVWDFIHQQSLDFIAGNVVKYICRAGLKTGATKVEDLQKAQRYITKAIELASINHYEQNTSGPDGPSLSLQNTYEAADCLFGPEDTNFTEKFNNGGIPGVS